MSATCDVSILQERIGYTFRDPALLAQALTHASFTNESPAQDGECYERLEFLGDAVLEMVTSTWLFHAYPDLREGELTRMRASLVCEDALFCRAERFDLKSFIRLGKGEEKKGGRQRPSLISDVTEALIGAICLDGGIEQAEKFIETFVLNDIPDPGMTGDFKTRLQETAQAAGRTDLRYEVLSESGPAHERTYCCAVYLGDELLGRGEGSSKRKAQQKAAEQAIIYLKE